jgi:hypothetical protein
MHIENWKTERLLHIGFWLYAATHIEWKSENIDVKRAEEMLN